MTRTKRTAAALAEAGIEISNVVEPADGCDGSIDIGDDGVYSVQVGRGYVLLCKDHVDGFEFFPEKRTIEEVIKDYNTDRQ